MIRRARTFTSATSISALLSKGKDFLLLLLPFLFFQIPTLAMSRFKKPAKPTLETLPDEVSLDIIDAVKELADSSGRNPLEPKAPSGTR